jgi:WD40 repeat protein
VRFSPNGKEMLAGCSDGTLYISDIEKQACVAKCISSNNDLNSVSYGLFLK